MLHSLDHVLLAVRDLATATRSYTELLGRRPSWRGEHPGYGTANALFRLDNLYLELLAPAGPGFLSRDLEQRLEREGEGLLGLAFGTDDAQVCAKSLRERGLAALDPTSGEGRDLETGALRRWRNVFLPPDQTRGVMLFAIQHLSPPEALPRAEPACQDAAAVISGLDHVVINTTDADASRALYGEGLGIRLALDRSFEKRGVRLLFFRIGGVTVELAARLDAPAGVADEADRLWGLAWSVPDVDAARERLVAAGFDVSSCRPGHKPGTRVCSVRNGTRDVPTLLISPEPPSA